MTKSWGVTKGGNNRAKSRRLLQTASAIKKPEKIGLKVKAASPLRRLSPKNRSGFMTGGSAGIDTVEDMLRPTDVKPHLSG